MKNLSLLFVVGILFLAGCGKKIDASSEKEMKKSIESIVKSMTAEEAEQFKKDCIAVIFFNQKDNAEAYKILDGKTPQEVNVMANEIREKLRLIEEQRRIEAEKQRAIREAELKRLAEERRANEIASLKNRIEKLKQIELENIKNQKQLARIVITGARFARIKDGFMERPVIAFHIDNKTDKTISKIFCYAVLKSKGRKVAWLKDSFNYSFKGGLNPGEKQKLALAPNMFSDWGKLENRNDYILTITIKGLEDENEKPLWQIQDNVSEEIEAAQKQLNELENKKI